MRSRLKEVIQAGIDVKRELQGTNSCWIECNWQPKEMVMQIKDFGSGQAFTRPVCCIPQAQSDDEVLASAIGFSHFSLKPLLSADSDDSDDH